MFYEIVAIINSSPGNGHFEDVLEWFENSCRRDNKSLRFCEVWNQNFMKHLKENRGFIAQGRNNLVKNFKKNRGSCAQYC